MGLHHRPAARKKGGSGMKKRIRKTGEIVDVISYNKYTSTARNSELDWVSYIDSKGVEHEHEKRLNIYWDFEDVEEVLSTDIDWKQRRYEIAKEVFASIYDFTIDRINFAKYAVDAADALIAELKKGGER